MTRRRSLRETTANFAVDFQRKAGHPLSQTDQAYLSNIERIVCFAYQHSLVVEITLLDPWNPSWATSPFNTANAKSGQGFNQYQYFASLTGDTPRSQNALTRTYQKNGIVAIVHRLKNYPNIIWEVANEPDFIPGSAGGVSIGNVVTWEDDVVSWIRGEDTSHLIMANGHTTSSYAWDVSSAGVEAAHYTQIHDSYQGSQFEGAVDIEQNFWNQGWALALTENRALPDLFNGCGNVDSRTVDDVRAEAWELVVGGGGLFNSYSYQMNYFNDCGDSTRDPKAVSPQLYQLQEFLTAPLDSWGDPIDLSSAAPTTCVAGNWCSGITPWGQSDNDPNDSPACRNTAHAYWSTMASANSHVLYVHHGNLLSQTYGFLDDGFHDLPCGNGSTSGFRTPLMLQVQTTGCWSQVWVDPKTGATLSQTFANLTAGAPPVAAAAMPYYKDDIAFVLAYYSTHC